jgi:Flp pilus assembly protein TadG
VGNIGPGKSRRSRQGSLVIEGAFAILPMLALLFGILDIALAIFVRNTMEFAVRQGVRYAVTSQTMLGQGHDNSIKTVVDNNAMGLLRALAAEGDGRDRIIIDYYDPATIELSTGPGSNIGGNIVVVSATGLSWAWMVPLLRDAAPLQFSVSSADIMEATPIAGPPAR